MASLGSIVKYFFLVLFTALLAGTLPVLVLLQSSASVALDPIFYKNELDRAGIYDYAYVKINQTVSEKEGDQASAIMALSGISFSDLVTRGWMKTQAENIIDHGLAYVRGQETPANLTIELTEPKANLLAAADAKIQQLPKILQSAASGQIPALKQQFDQQVPDRINLAEQPGARNALDQARKAVSLFQSVLLGLLFFALVLTGLIIALARKSLNSISRWLGTGLLLGGALSFGALSLAQSKLNEALAAYAAVPEGAMLAKVAADGFAAVQQAAFPFVAAMILLGLIGIAASFLLKPAQEAETKAKTKAAPVAEGNKHK